MKGITTLAVAAFLSVCVDGLRLQERRDGPPRVVHFSTQRRHITNPASRDRLRRRANTAQVTLDNEETLYFANATIGTPPQNFRLHIDTGSSDLWVNSATSAFCSKRGRPCAEAGTYSANASSTYSYIASNFNISYVDGTGAAGDYVSDTITLGSTTLNRLQFGVGYTSSTTQGILGIGYTINEVQVGRAGKPAYNNLPAQMVADGIIQSNAYSLWLNDLDANTGSILFGGVDTAQYTGSLQTLPVQKEAGVFAEFLITLTGMSLGDTVIAKNQAQAVLLDSGSSLTYLPDAMTEAIYEQVSAQWYPPDGVAYVPCTLATNTSKLTFTFSSPSISVGMDELVITALANNGKPLSFSDGTAACIFGIAPAGSSTAVLGDTFIRSAYLVYDLENNEISIAQTNFNTTSTKVVEITTGANAVPDASAVANPVAAQAGLQSNTGTKNSGFGTSTSRAAAEKTRAPAAFGAVMMAGAGLMYAAM